MKKIVIFGTIVILGWLGYVLVFSFRQAAITSTAVTMQKQLITAIQLFEKSHGELPLTLGDLSPGFLSETNLDVFASKWKDGFIGPVEYKRKGYNPVKRSENALTVLRRVCRDRTIFSDLSGRTWVVKN